MSVRNHTKKFIDFDFVELRGVYPAQPPVLRLPRPHLASPKRLREGEEGSEEPKPTCG